MVVKLLARGVGKERIGESFNERIFLVEETDWHVKCIDQ